MICAWRRAEGRCRKSRNAGWQEGRSASVSGSHQDRLTTVHWKANAGDELRLVRGEEDRRIGDIPCSAHLPQGNGTVTGCSHFLDGAVLGRDLAINERCVDGAGQDG